MYTRAQALALLIAVAQARFGQEQVPIPAIAAVQGGAAGAAPTIAGAAISDLLAGSNACDKLRRGDQILAELGTGADAVAAAIGIVGAEKNFNPFVQTVPTICSDPTLPVNEVLRGITPLIDPDVDGAAAVNALAAQTAGTPLNAAGKSVADLLRENGFSNFIAQDSAGATVQPAAGAGANAGAAAGDAGNATGNANAGAGAAAGNADQCAAAVSSALAAADQAAATQAAGNGNNGNGNGNGNGNNNGNGNGKGNGNNGNGHGNNGNGNNGNGNGNNGNGNGNNGNGNGNMGNGNAGNAGAAAGGAADFGQCVPTISFEGGRANRAADEFTFLPIDPLVAQGQQEALNPNIITNRVCDQLTNVCNANQAAKDLCRDAQAQIQALGTRDKSTADTWNTLLGFAGAVTNPSGGPAEPPAKMRVVRSFRA